MQTIPPVQYLQGYFEVSPVPTLLVLPDAPKFTILDANKAYLKATGAAIDDLAGKGIFEAFPDNPGNETANGVANLSASLQRVISTGKPHKMAPQRYDVPVRGTGAFEERYYDPENIPIVDPGGCTLVIVHTVSDITERMLQQKRQRRLEKESQLAQAELHQLTTVSQAANWELDLETGAVFWSDEMFRICGFEPQSFIPGIERGIALIHPDDRQKVQAALDYALATGEVYRIEHRVVRPDGEVLQGLSTGITVWDAKGKAVKVNGIFQNITGNRQMENMLAELVNTLQQRNSFIEDVLENLPVGIAVNQITDGKTILLNRHFKEIYGWDEEDLANIPTFLEKVYPDKAYREEVMARTLIDINSGDLQRMSWDGLQARTKDGGTRIINARNIPLYGQGLMISARLDVTNEARKAQEIARTKANQEALINATGDLLWSVDTEMNVITANRAFIASLLPYSKEPLKEGDSLMLEAFSQPVLEQWRNRYTRALAGETFSVYHEFFNPAGQMTMYSWVSFTPMYNQAGEIFGVACHSKDITEDRLNKLNLDKALAAAGEANQRFIYAARATFDTIWDWDIVQKKIIWGEGFEAVFGYGPSNRPDGENAWSANIHPEDIGRVLSGIDACIAGTGDNWEDEYRYRRADDSYAHVLDKGFIIRDPGGKAIRMVGAMRDITEKKELRNLLDKANRLARIGGWEVNLVKNTVWWSDITREIHGAPPGFEPTIETGTNFYKEGVSRETIVQKITAAIRDGEPWDAELQILTVQGEEKWVRAIGEAEFVNGACARLYGSFQDIDARKKAELAVIQTLEEKYTILESIGDAFFAVDHNWKVTYWNTLAGQVLHMPKNRITGQNLWDVFTGQEETVSWREYHQAMQTGQAAHFEDCYTLLDRWFEVSAYPSPSGLSVYFKDITDRKKTEEEHARHVLMVEKQNEKLREIAWIQSHVVRAPLARLMGIADLVKDMRLAAPEGEALLDHLLDSAAELDGIIRDIVIKSSQINV